MSVPGMQVRPLASGDLEPLLDLYGAAFPSAARPRAELRRKLGQLFLDGPLCDAALPSLVACDAEGGLIGFRGRVRRSWRMGSEPLLGSTATHLMVREDLRRAGVGRALRQASRAIEERTGVRSEVGYSDRATADGRAFSRNNDELERLEQYGFDWAAPARRLGVLAGRALGRLRGRLPDRTAGRALLSLAAAGARRLPGVVGPASDSLRSVALTASGLQEAVAAAGEGLALRLDEPLETWAWLLEYLRDYPSRGRLVGRVWLGPGGAPAGFYAGYLNRSGALELLGFAARRDDEEAARREVLREAAAAGATWVTGTACARELRVLIGLGARVSAGSRASLRTRRADVVQRFQAMDVLLTGLEGERWL